METKDRKRRFINNECNHIYQRTVNGFLIFYDREDYLVSYMILSVMARKYNVTLLKICFMIDHIHLLIDAPSREIMAAFMRDYSSVLIHEYNISIGRSGQMLHKSYGSAPKKGNKKTRSTIIYIGNNPVEKKLCIRAEDYRWNFLKYFVDDCPFSVRISLSESSRPLRRCIKIVKSTSRSNVYLNYTILRDMFGTLSESEQEYLTDYIIMSYFPFDKDILLSYYEDWNQMIEAMHSTAGSEHDIKEVFSYGSDQIYYEMVRYIKDEKMICPVRSVTVLPFEQKMILFNELRIHTGAAPYEIKKFLHMK